MLKWVLSTFILSSSTVSYLGAALRVVVVIDSSSTYSSLERLEKPAQKLLAKRKQCSYYFNLAEVLALLMSLSYLDSPAPQRSTNSNF